MMKKQIVTFFLMLLPVVASAETVIIDGICYNLNDENNVAEVTTNSKKYTGELDIPATFMYEGTEYRVTSIGNWAFSQCRGLTSVTIPNSVTSIEACAFYQCFDLTTVNIPNSVTTIGPRAFAYSRKLTDVDIPGSVITIGEGAFEDCISLNNVTIPYGVTSIEGFTFCGCEGLISVTIPNSVTNIGVAAFKECIGLISVTIPNSVTSIGRVAFEFCQSLTSITIPNSVTSIGELAFYCDNLTKVVSLIEDPFEIIGKEFNRRTFPLQVFNNATLYVPEGTIEKYRKTAGWKDFWHIEEGSHTSLKSVEANSISINGKGGMLTIDGAVEGTPVNVYDTTGRLHASVMTTRQATRIATPLRKGAVAIVKVGDRVEKVVMK